MARAGVRDFGALASVAVAVGPGLAPCLRAGVRRAAHIARAFGVPLAAVNHVGAHALLAGGQPFPYLAAVLSGGHSLLLRVAGVDRFTLVGGTLDDALGESFDKVAQLLAPFGDDDDDAALAAGAIDGALVERLARDGDPRSQQRLTRLRPMAKYEHCHLSFAGLKTGAKLSLVRRWPAARRSVSDIVHRLKVPMMQPRLRKRRASLRQSAASRGDSAPCF